MAAAPKHQACNRPGRLFCDKSCNRTGGLATNPPCEDCGVLHRTATRVCNRGPATNPHYQPHPYIVSGILDHFRNPGPQRRALVKQDTRSVRKAFQNCQAFCVLTCSPHGPLLFLSRKRVGQQGSIRRILRQSKRCSTRILISISCRAAIASGWGKTAVTLAVLVWWTPC